MLLRCVLFLGHLADYAAKLALLARLAREPNLKMHFAALVVVHVAANVHGAHIVLRGYKQRLPHLVVLPSVLVIGIATPMLQVVHLCDAFWERRRGARGRTRSRLPLAPLAIVLEGSVFMLVSLHLRFSHGLGRVVLVAGAPTLLGRSASASGSACARVPSTTALASLTSSSVFDWLLALATVTSLVHLTSGLVLWDSTLSLKLARDLFESRKGSWSLVVHAVLRGNEVAGRAALLAILAVVLRPPYAANYLAGSYLVHLLVLAFGGSPLSTWESAILAWPILFANLPQFVDSPKHAGSAQSVTTLVCGLRALELAVAASVTTAVVLLEPDVEDKGEGIFLDMVQALRMLCRKREVIVWGFFLLLHYVCMLVRWCANQGEGESDTLGCCQRPGYESPLGSGDASSPLMSEAFWPPAFDLSQLLLQAGLERSVPNPPASPSPPWQIGSAPSTGRGSARSAAEAIGSGMAAEEVQQPRVQDFDMIRTIGCGEFGQVCQVRWRATQDIFAMKRLSKLEYARRRITEKARREAMILQAARGHPFVVELYFAIESIYEWALVMEYCPHGDLQQLLLAEGSPGLELGRIVKIAAEVTLALEHLHSRGIAFRDLKLENVVLGQDGHAKLTDFGLAKQIEGGRDAIAEAERNGGAYAAFTKTFCGSYGYTAPEVSLRRQVHGFAADMYSFGVLLLMLLIGGEVQHIAQGPPWERRLPPETPFELNAVLDTLKFDFYWAAHNLLRPARAAHRVEVNLKGDTVLASRRARVPRRQQNTSRPPSSPRTADVADIMEATSAIADQAVPGAHQRPAEIDAQGPAPAWPPASTGVMDVGLHRSSALALIAPFHASPSHPAHFPDSACTDSSPALRRWELAVGLIRVLVDEMPEQRGTIATLKAHPFFTEAITDWWLVYPRSWLRERVAMELKTLAGGALPRGVLDRLETLPIEALSALLRDQGTQLEVLSHFQLPRASEWSAAWPATVDSGSSTSANVASAPTHAWCAHYR